MELPALSPHHCCPVDSSQCPAPTAAVFDWKFPLQPMEQSCHSTAGLAACFTAGLQHRRARQLEHIACSLEFLMRGKGNFISFLSAPHPSLNLAVSV